MIGMPIILTIIKTVIMELSYYNNGTCYPNHYHEIAIGAYYHTLTHIIIHDNSYDNSHVIEYYSAYYHAW